MADAIKSVLFVEYDSLWRALGGDSGAGERLAARVPAWIAAIEQGRLAPSADPGMRRRVLMRRCYANPALLGDKRRHFTGNGFLVVDSPPLDGHDRSAADIQMALDTIDALGHPTSYDEFILLSGNDIGPVLIRLRAHNRHTVIFAPSDVPEAYRVLADAFIEQEPFVALLTASDEPKAAEVTAPRAAQATGAQPAAPAGPAPDRNEIEALARKVHGATNVPLFSPKSYLELFRVLAAEIAENGYHFQSTAENVAAKLTASGRNATRRQIVFIVKGLALKGHVFSNTDTPERLAEVFREQVLYLCRNAGVELSARELAVMPAWIIGRGGSTVAAVAAELEISEPAPTPPPPPPPKPAAPVAATPPPRPAEDAKAATRNKKPPKPAIPPPKPTPPRPAVFGERPAEPVKPAPGAPSRPGVFPRPLAPAARPGAALAAKPATAASTPARPATPAPSSAASSKPTLITPKPLSSRPTAPKAPAAPVAEKPVAPPQPEPPAAEATPPPQPEKAAAEKPAAEKTAPEKPQGSAVESTILAAIAQAVDVLVEDRGAARTMERESERSAAEEPPPPRAEDVPPPSPDSDDIGDEIQRIIASYNRDRQQSD